MAASQTASAPIGPIPRQAATALQHPESVPVPVPAAHFGTQSTTGTTAPERRYYINVGLFADESNARKAYVKLQEAGVVAFTQALDTPSGKRTRVRAGPYASQAQAQVVAEKIRALQLEAVVFRQ